MWEMPVQKKARNRKVRKLMNRYIKCQTRRVLLKVIFCISALYIAIVLSGCTSNINTVEENGKINVVTTIFPYYDFVRQVAGDKVNLTMSVPAGMDTHSFEPTAADMINIENADVIIYNGGEMEVWVDEVLNAVSNKKIMVDKMMDAVDVVIEEINGESTDEYDEHIWTSPMNASKIVYKIADILSEADKFNSEYYHNNADMYSKKLKDLDSQFKELISSSDKKHLVFADRFPLRYFVDEYGLTYSAAFAGCSTEVEPSADTIAFLIDKVREENIPVILKIELTSARVADAVAEETSTEVMTFYTCHNVTKEQFDSGTTYCDLMEENIGVLKKALL